METLAGIEERQRRTVLAFGRALVETAERMGLKQSRASIQDLTAWALRVRVEKRRADKDFMDRLKLAVEHNKTALELLAK
jgi:predicted LPLAT superfamily acyltransferase